MLHRSFATKLSSILPFHIENIIPSYETIRAYKDKIDASFKEEYKDAHHYNIKQGRFMVGGYRNIRYPSTWTFQHPQIYNNLKNNNLFELKITLNHVSLLASCAYPYRLLQ